MPRRILGLALLVAVITSVSTSQGREPAPPAGTWKVILPVLGDAAQASWLVRFDQSGDTWKGSIVATAEGVPDVKVEDVRVQGESLGFTLRTANLTLPATVKLGKTALKGEVTVRGKASPIVLEATTMTALDDFALAQEVLSRPENTRETFRAVLTLLALAGPRKATLTQIDAWAKRGALAAAGFGPEQREALVTLASYLAEQPTTAFLAIAYAEQAEKLVTIGDPPVVHKRVLRVLAVALERAGKETEARVVRERNEAIEILRLKPYAGKAKNVVLVENFTCAQQQKCLATDLACEGLERTYGKGEVLVLCAHLGVPGPDPLANLATEERERYYRPRVTPGLYFNGKPAGVAGGSIDDAQARYDDFVAALNPLIEKAPGMPAPPKLTLKALAKGDLIEVEAIVADLAAPNANLRLRVAIVEDVVEYTGSNGLPRHRNVVRDYIGSAAGLALLEKVSTRNFTVNVVELRQKLRTALDKTHQATPFPGRVWPTELKRLRLVAYVQNDETREILTAVAANVVEE